ncbi:MAG TPA: hypothetical protein VJ201_05195 [Candidatus Babeliales bacterium]|nr:hypothetical protein [Candidatus Babeliales bacterium]
MSKVQEKWEVWRPILHTQELYTIDTIKSDHDSLYLTLVGKTNKISIEFHDSVASYMHIEESFRTETICTLSEQLGEKFNTWMFYQVRNSLYIQWFCDEFGCHNRYVLTHFAIIDENSFLEILAYREPEFKITESV